MRKLVILIVFVLLLLVACVPGRREKGQEVETFRTGSQGLQLQFVQNLPPLKTYDTEDFNAMLEIKNVGAHDVGAAGDRVYISGFDTNIITGIPFTGNTIRIEGKDQFNIQGGFDTTAFKGIVRRLTTDVYPFNLVATACYAYETQASANVCIDPDPYSPTVKTKACAPQNVAIGTQAAPVAVNSVEVDARPQKTVFKIQLANVGGGDVFRFGGNYLTKCSPYDPRGLAYDEVDYVQLTDVIVSGVSIKRSCKPLDQDHIRLTGGKGIVVCEFANIRSNAAYTTPLTIVLRYGYRNQVQQRVEIIRTA